VPPPVPSEHELVEVALQMAFPKAGKITFVCVIAIRLDPQKTLGVKEQPIGVLSFRTQP
jgi:hypothetical protein